MLTNNSHNICNETEIGEQMIEVSTVKWTAGPSWQKQNTDRANDTHSKTATDRMNGQRRRRQRPKYMSVSKIERFAESVERKTEKPLNNIH